MHNNTRHKGRDSLLFKIVCILRHSMINLRLHVWSVQVIILISILRRISARTVEMEHIVNRNLAVRLSLSS